MTTSDQIELFPFRHQPFRHQLDCWRLSRDREYFGLLMDMGTGKSKVLIDTAAWLFLKQKIDGVIVLAPKGCYADWRDNHFPTHMPESLDWRCVEWRADPSKGLMEELRAIAKAEPGKLHCLSMNIEAVLGELPYRILKHFLQHHRTLLAIDESTVLGNPSAKRTKAILKLRELAKYRRIMTGDISPDNPLTVYSQAEFLKQYALDNGSFFGFKAEYCQQVQQNFGGRRFNQIVGYRNLDKLQAKLSEFCFVVKKEDCLDLPPKIYQVRYVEMGPKQRAAYKQMEEQAIVTLEAQLAGRQDTGITIHGAAASEQDVLNAIAHMSGLMDGTFERDAAEPLADPSKMSTASLVIKQLLRLHQIACGFIVTDDHQEHDFDEPNARLQGLMDVLAETSGKVLIWACYRRNIQQIAAAIAKQYGEDSIATYFGDTKDDERREVKREFQDRGSRLKYFVGNQQTGKYGLTLTAANTAVYYANTYQREARSQSEDRSHRIGQDRSVTYVDLAVRKTVDTKILKVILEDKRQLSALISPSNWRRLFAGD